MTHGTFHRLVRRTTPQCADKICRYQANFEAYGTIHRLIIPENQDPSPTQNIQSVQQVEQPLLDWSEASAANTVSPSEPLVFQDLLHHPMRKST